jgi:hypothetical protein
MPADGTSLPGSEWSCKLSRSPWWLWLAATLAAASLGVSAGKDEQDNADPHGADPEYLAARAWWMAETVLTFLSVSAMG